LSAYVKLTYNSELFHDAVHSAPVRMLVAVIKTKEVNSFVWGSRTAGRAWRVEWPSLLQDELKHGKYVLDCRTQSGTSVMLTSALPAHINTKLCDKTQKHLYLQDTSDN